MYPVAACPARICGARRPSRCSNGRSRWAPTRRSARSRATGCPRARRPLDPAGRLPTRPRCPSPASLPGPSLHGGGQGGGLLAAAGEGGGSLRRRRSTAAAVRRQPAPAADPRRAPRRARRIAGGGGAVGAAARAAAQTIEALAELVAGFDLCPLKRTATNTVFMDGNPAARVMIVGEAPGAEEDRTGTPVCRPRRPAARPHAGRDRPRPHPACRSPT